MHPLPQYPMGVRTPPQPSLGRRAPLRPWPSPHAVPELQRPRHSTAAGKHARGVTRVGMNDSSPQSEARPTAGAPTDLGDFDLLSCSYLMKS
jgi:hypothetical protein